MQGSPGPGLLQVVGSVLQASQSAHKPRLASLAVRIAEGLCLLSVCQQHPGLSASRC